MVAPLVQSSSKPIRQQIQSLLPQKMHEALLLFPSSEAAVSFSPLSEMLALICPRAAYFSVPSLLALGMTSLP